MIREITVEEAKRLYPRPRTDRGFNAHPVLVSVSKPRQIGMTVLLRAYVVADYHRRMDVYRRTIELAKRRHPRGRWS